VVALISTWSAMTGPPAREKSLKFIVSVDQAQFMLETRLDYTTLMHGAIGFQWVVAVDLQQDAQVYPAANMVSQRIAWVKYSRFMLEGKP